MAVSMSSIKTIEVDGNEYAVVGPDGAYPLSIAETGDSSGDEYSEYSVSVSFHWKKSYGTGGSTEYSLVGFVREAPDEVTYNADASGC